MFTYGCREDTYQLPVNPVPGPTSDAKPIPALDYYEVEEVEALARACEAGEHRTARPRSMTRSGPQRAGGPPGRRGLPCSLLYRDPRRRILDASLGGCRPRRVVAAGSGATSSAGVRRYPGVAAIGTSRCLTPRWRHSLGLAPVRVHQSPMTHWSATAGAGGCTVGALRRRYYLACEVARTPDGEAARPAPCGPAHPARTAPTLVFVAGLPRYTSKLSTTDRLHVRSQASPEDFEPTLTARSGLRVGRRG